MPFIPAQPEIEGHGLKKLINKLSGQPESYAHKSNYIFGKTLGAGSFGVVRQARNVTTKEDVAVKIVLKKALRGKEDAFYEELNLLQKCNHPHIVGFRDWFESKDKFYIVTQLATGGELFERIVTIGKFTEKDATKVIEQILDAVRYLHNELNIVHRDLKPENLLYVSVEEDSPLVLADFGIAKELKTPDDYLTAAAGSLGYCAPEVLIGNGHGRPCDIWSLGVITYTLLAGYSPFRAESVDDFLQEVNNDQPVVFHREHWSKISNLAKDFILRAITVDQNKRATADELLHHPWISGAAEEVAETDLIPCIKKFNAKQKFRQAVELVKLNNRIKKLRNVYDGMDDSDLALVEVSTEDTTNSKRFDFSKLSNILKSPDSSSPVGTPRGGDADKSKLTAGLFHQIVKAATENKEKVKNFRDDEGEPNKAEDK
jgi:calcium/calmodulin-dependent protein kinase I